MNTVRILALVRFMVVCSITACGDSGTGSAPDVDETLVDTVVVISPDSFSIASLSDTIQLRAAVLDQRGNAVAGATVRWSSLDPDILAVTGDGRAAAKVRGLLFGRVAADAGSASDTAKAMIRITRCSAPAPISNPSPATAALPSYTLHQITSEEWPYPETFPWIASLDIGRDGTADVFVETAKLNNTPNQDEPGGALFLLVNDGTGNFARDSLPIPPEAVNSPVRPVVFDADGDGLDDVLAGQFGLDSEGSTGAEDLLLIQRSQTLVDESSRLNPNESRSTNVYTTATADIDCDGDVDFFSGAADSPSRLYVNDGMGNFTPEDDRTPSDVSGDFFGAETNFQGAGFCDVNRDTAPDLMLTFGIERDRLLINDGFGRFEDAEEGTFPRIPPSSDAVREFVVCEDFDRDGWNDLVLGESTSTGGVLRLWLNNGDGSLRDATAEHFSAALQVRNMGGLEPADLDGDGWTDLVALCDVLMNDQGTFVHHRLDPFVTAPFRCFNEQGLPQMSTVVPLIHGSGRVDLYLNTGPPAILSMN